MSDSKQQEQVIDQQDQELEHGHMDNEILKDIFELVLRLSRCFVDKDINSGKTSMATNPEDYKIRIKSKAQTLLKEMSDCIARQTINFKLASLFPELAAIEADLARATEQKTVSAPKKPRPNSRR